LSVGRYGVSGRRVGMVVHGVPASTGEEVVADDGPRPEPQQEGIDIEDHPRQRSPLERRALAVLGHCVIAEDVATPVLPSCVLSLGA